jgi:hypothetical protein
LARIFLGMLSLAIYIALALAQVQKNDDSGRQWTEYDIERTPMASAISHIVYGAPVASVYAGLNDEFVRSKEPLEVTLEKAKRKEIEPRNLIPFGLDGIGAGEAIFATVAMRVFGIHVSSILWSFLTLMTIAVTAFLLRFPDSRALVAVAGLSALILMFASPVGTTAANISQIPVGGYRYFSLLAAIPGMHVFLELISDEKTMSQRRAIIRWLLLLAQLAVFAIALYVNIATIYLYGPFAFAIAYAHYRARRERPARQAEFRKIIVVVAVIGAALIASKVVAPKAYRDTGRNGDMIWGRIVVSLGVKPKWPFGTLAAEYKGCFPEEPDRTLEPDMNDFNLHCIWSDYAERHNMSRSEKAWHLYDGTFNKALRSALFKIVRRYPLDTLMTFIYYKPLLLGHTLLSLFTFTEPVPGWVALLISAQFLVLFAFALIEAQSSSQIATVAISLGLGAISTCGLYIVAWANSWTTGDLFFYLLALLVVGFVALLTAAARLLLLPEQKRFEGVPPEVQTF